LLSRWAFLCPLPTSREFCNGARHAVQGQPCPFCAAPAVPIGDVVRRVWCLGVTLLLCWPQVIPDSSLTPGDATTQLTACVRLNNPSCQSWSAWPVELLAILAQSPSPSDRARLTRLRMLPLGLAGGARSTLVYSCPSSWCSPAFDTTVRARALCLHIICVPLVWFF